MQLLPALLALLATSALAQDNDPPCIKACTSGHAISSECNGDETGAALDQCLCATFESSVATPLLTCVKACSASDQAVFAANLPALCRAQVLPGVTPASTTGGGSSPTTTAGGSGGSQTSATTSSGGGAATNSAKPGAAAGLVARAPVAAAGGLLAAALLL
jgi:hypothetical protein